MKKKTITKRIVFLLLAFMLVFTYIPIPKAEATAIPLPIPAPNFLPFIPGMMESDPLRQQLDDLGMSQVYPFESIIALYETMCASLRAIGIQGVEKYDIPGYYEGLYIPTSKTDYLIHQMEQSAVIFNGLTATLKNEVWEQAQIYGETWTSGAESIVSFSSDLLNSVRSLFNTNFPTQSTEIVGSQTIHIVPGASLYDAIMLNGTDINISNGAIQAKYVPITYPYTGYRYTGEQVTITPTSAQTPNPADYDGVWAVMSVDTHPSSMILNRGYVDFWWLVKNKITGLISRWAIANIRTGKGNADQKIQFDFDFDHQFPNTTTLRMPPFPSIADPIKHYEAVAGELNLTGYDDLVKAPDIPITGDDLIKPGSVEWQYLGDLVGTIKNILEWLRNQDPTFDVMPFINALDTFPPARTDPYTRQEYERAKGGLEWLRDYLQRVYTGEIPITPELAQEIERALTEAGAKIDAGAGTQTGTLNLQPLTSFTGFANLFPFSLPWDMVNFFESLNAPRETPNFIVELPPIMANSVLTIDLEFMDSLAALFRNLTLGLWILGLMLVSRSMIKW